MISCCDNGAQRLACIRSWKSTSVHVSDFVFEAGAGVAIDAKTTSTSNRRHIITSVDQVAQGIHLDTGLLSIMIRQVADGEGWSIGHHHRIGVSDGQAWMITSGFDPSIDEDNLMVYFSGNVMVALHDFPIREYPRVLNFHHCHMVFLNYPGRSTSPKKGLPTTT